MCKLVLSGTSVGDQRSKKAVQYSQYPVERVHLSTVFRLSAEPQAYCCWFFSFLYSSR